MMLAALSSVPWGMPQIVIVGDRASASTATSCVPPPLPADRDRRPGRPEHRDRLSRRAAVDVGAMTATGGPAVYVCRDFVCQLPARTATNSKDHS